MIVAPAPLTTRLATDADVPALTRMFQQFVASTQYAEYVGQDPAHCENMMWLLAHDPNAAVFVVGDDPIVGMLGVMTFTQPFSGELVASELFWWLDQEHRGHGGWLLRRGEKWARDKGAKRITMMAPVNKPRVAVTYGKLGYNEVERIFSKDLR